MKFIGKLLIVAALFFTIQQTQSTEKTSLTKLVDQTVIIDDLPFEH